MRNLRLLPLFAILFASLTAYAEPAAEKSNGLDGAALYAEHCVECHGAPRFRHRCRIYRT